MATKFASAKPAHGFCDICGFRYPLSQLRTLVVMGRRVNLRACRACHDPDHPQNWVGIIGAQKVANDPQSLFNPRPDTTYAESRGECGWNPVGSQPLTYTLNNVDIRTSPCVVTVSQRMAYTVNAPTVVVADVLVTAPSLGLGYTLTGATLSLTQTVNAPNLRETLTLNSPTVTVRFIGPYEQLEGGAARVDCGSIAETVVSSSNLGSVTEIVSAIVDLGTLA